MKAEDLLRRWSQHPPRDGSDCEDAIAVMRYLGMEVVQRKTGHWTGKHQLLIGSDPFPHGVVTVNCHAFGIQGRAHPQAIRDILKAAKIIEEAEANG